MKKFFSQKILWLLVLIPFFLTGSCTKKSTCPVQPTVYLMKDYFPLNEGDEWTWEITAHDSIQEIFFDGDVSLGEPFVDQNGNGIYDPGIDSFDVTMDLNQNGRYDGPLDLWTPGIPYEDLNGDGEFDYPNGIWDKGESFADLDGNNTCGKAIHLTLDLRSQHWNGPLVYLSGGYCFTMHNDNSHWDVTLRWQDAFSNDTLGLRWHAHADPEDWREYLNHMRPITLANAETRIGDTVSYADTSYPEGVVGDTCRWISILEAVENVCVPAGGFQGCLRFKHTASAWVGNMTRYNGTSYWWYAKNVGLVKSEGPNPGEHWRLKSAIINGRSYP
jgi:hypothetical protein